MTTKTRAHVPGISSFLGFASGLLISTLAITVGTRVFASGSTGSIFALVSPMVSAPGGNFAGGVVNVMGWTPDLDLAGIQFQVNGVNLGSEITSGACAVAWDTRGGPDGTYVVSAIARDAASNIHTSAPVTVTVENSPPTISSVAVANMSSASALVTWATNQPSSSQVDFGTTMSYGSSTADFTMTTAHSQTLTGLVPSTTYHFRVQSRNVASAAATSGDFVFNTGTVNTASDGRMSLDTPADGSHVGLSFTVAGWAADLAAASGAGVDAVHVWAVPSAGSPLFLGSATYGGPRPDVGAAFGSQFTNTAFGLTVASLPIGTYTITVYAHSTITGTFNQVRTATVALGPLPAMSLDAPARLATVGSSFSAAGWAIDQAATTGTGVDAVHLWAYPNPGSGQAAVFLGVAAYGGPRSDVGASFGAQFTNSSFFLPITTLSAGAYRIVAYAHSTVTGTFNNLQTADVTVAGPLMAIDMPASGASQSGPFTVAGWAIDRSAATGAGVDVINVWAIPVAGGSPIFVGSGGYGSVRPDVAAIFGSRFANSGYNTRVSLPAGTPAGTYDFIVYAHSTASGTFNQSQAVRVTMTKRQ
jgi:hypothetical protein